MLDKIIDLAAAGYLKNLFKEKEKKKKRCSFGIL